MLLDFYSLKEHPFDVTPNLAFLFLTSSHREALASLFHAVDTDQPFAALVAPPGMGKTTLLLRLLERLSKGQRAAMLFKTRCDSQELLRCLLTEMGHPPQDLDLVVMHLQLNELLIQQPWKGKQFVILIDEAHDLENEVLVTIRLLSYLGTPDKKLVQIVLAGRPQMTGNLARPGLQQLVQWVSVMACLEPFSTRESKRYIEHRLKVAGYQGPPLFTEAALSRIVGESRGIPLLINAVCSNVLHLGFARQQRTIDEPVVRHVIANLDLRALFPEPSVLSKAPEVASMTDSTNRSGMARQAGLEGVTTAAQISPSPAAKFHSKDRPFQSAFTRWLDGLLDEQAVFPEKSAGAISHQFSPGEGTMGGISGYSSDRESAVEVAHRRAFPGIARPRSREDFERTPFARWLQGIKDVETSGLSFSKEEQGNKELSRAAAAAQSIPSTRISASESALLEEDREAVSTDSFPPGQKGAMDGSPRDSTSSIGPSTEVNGYFRSSSDAPRDISPDPHMAKAADGIVLEEEKPSLGLTEEVPKFLLSQPPRRHSRLFPIAVGVLILTMAGGLIRHFLVKNLMTTGEEGKAKLSSQVPGDNDQSPPTDYHSARQDSPREDGKSAQGALVISPSDKREPERSPELLTVMVGPDQNLRQICLHYLGRYNSKLVEDIKELNPQLKDPDYVQIGQWLRLPVRAVREGEGGFQVPGESNQEKNNARGISKY